MPIVKKTSDKKGYSNAVVSANVKSYADDPYFVKKAADAAQAIKTVGLPGNKKK